MGSLYKYRGSSGNLWKKVAANNCFNLTNTAYLQVKQMLEGLNLSKFMSNVEVL